MLWHLYLWPGSWSKQQHVCLRNHRSCVTCALGKHLKHETFEEAAGIALVHLYMVKCKNKFPLFRESNSRHATERREMKAPSPGNGNGGHRTGQGGTGHKLLRPFLCKPAPAGLSYQGDLKSTIGTRRKPSNIHKTKYKSPLLTARHH